MLLRTQQNGQSDAAPPEKSMQLQGLDLSNPLWNLGKVQSISLCLSLFSACLSIFPYLCVCRSSPETAVSPATFRCGLKLYTRSTFVLSELILIFLLESVHVIEQGSDF